MNKSTEASQDLFKCSSGKRFFLQALMLGLWLLANSVGASTFDISKGQVETISGPAERSVKSDQKDYFFDLAADQAMWVSIRKINSNLALDLFDERDIRIRQLQLADREIRFLNTLITPQDCNRCKLSISALGKVDRASQYRVIFTLIKWPESASQLDLKKRLSDLFAQWPQTTDDRKHLARVKEAATHLAEAARSAGDRDLSARGYYLASVAAHHLSETRQEIDALNKVLEVEPVQEFRLLAFNGLGNAFYRQGKWEAARDMLKRVLDQAGPEDDTDRGLAWSRLGNLDDRLGFPKRAAQNFSRALEFFEAQDDQYSMIFTRLNLGWSKFRAGKAGRAFTDYQQAATLSRQFEVYRFEADALNKLARVYAEMGDIDQALTLIDQSIEISEENTQISVMSFNRARSYQAKGIILIAYGLYDAAIDALHEAQNLYRKNNAETDEIDVSYLLGKSYFSNAEFEKADRFFRQTLEYDLKSENAQNIAQTYALLASTSLQQAEREPVGMKRQQEFQQAGHYQSRAFEYLSRVEDGVEDSEILGQAALIAFYNRRFEDADRYIDKALQASEKRHSAYQKTILDYHRAKLYSLKGDAAEALAILQKIHQRINQQSESIFRSDIKRAFLALQQKFSGLHVSLLFGQETADSQALEIAELYRARTLSESIASINRNNQLEQHQRTQRSRLQKNLADFAQAYYQVQPDQRSVHLKSIKQTSEKLQNLEAEINRQRNPGAMVTEGSIRKAIEKTVAGMKANQAMVYYDLNPDRSFYWLISSQGIRQHVLPAGPVIEKLVQRVLNGIGRAPTTLSADSKRDSEAALSELSGMLLGDDAQFWQQFSDLIIVPDQALNYLPFSVLQFPDSGDYLLDSRNITYAPSVFAYQRLQQKPAHLRQKGGMLVVANPAMRTPAVEVAALSQRGGFTISELPYTGLEARRIRQVSKQPVNVLTRQAASKQQFLKQPLEDFSILHFAMHGLSNSSLPTLGGLVFSNQDSEDNLLLATEISGLSLNAELVVISGCETGIGKNINGEGLLGLNRAFIEAGGRRVLASLWSVQDDATAEMMGEFYKNLLQRQQPPAVALRNAKLHVKNYLRPGEFHKRWQHPFYWAGFILQGDGSGQFQ